jgi:hypothetical protein
MHTRWAIHQHTLWRLDTEVLEFVGLLHRQDDCFYELLDLLVQTTL